MKTSSTPSVILCGGEGLRFRNTADIVQKVLVPVGEQPIIQRMMDIYAHHGVDTFYLCVRDDDTQIRKYFESNPQASGRKVSLVKTGNTTPTGGRVKAMESILQEEVFFLAYGDDLASVSLPDLVERHISMATTVTHSAARPRSPFGQPEINQQGMVQVFNEKPIMDDWVNAGFFVMNKRVFEYLIPGADLERETLPDLIASEELAAFQQKGFWQSMDTVKELSLSN